MRTDRRQLAFGLAALGALAASIAYFAWPFGAAAPPAAADAGTEHHSGPHEPQQSSLTGDAAAGAGGTPPAAQDAAPTDERTAIATGDVRVRAVDADGAGVADVTVSLGHADGHASYGRATTDARGACRFALLANHGPRERIRVLAAMPGRVVAVPLAGLPPEDVVVLPLGAFGTFAFTAPGASGAVSVTVDQWALDATPGPSVSLQLRDGGGSVRVAAGERYRVRAANAGQARTLADVDGPRSHGDVVPLAFDFARCTLAGRALDGPNGRAVTILLFAPDLESSGFGGGTGGWWHETTLGADGAFSVSVPRSRWPAFVALVDGARCAETGPLAIAGATADAGTLRFADRPRVGLLVATDEDGKWAPATDSPVAYRLRDGREITSAMSLGRVVLARTLRSKGTEYLGLPCIESVTVAPKWDEFFCDPPRPTLRGGETTAVRMLRGGSAVVHLAATGFGMDPLWLVHFDTGERAERTSGNALVGGGQTARFERLRAGEWQIHSIRPVLDGRFTVVASQCAEVHARLAPP